MKSQTSLVGADGVVELNTEAVVNAGNTVIVHPGHPEQDLTVGRGQSFQKSVLAVGFFVSFNSGGKGLQNFLDSLNEQFLIGILLNNSF